MKEASVKPGDATRTPSEIWSTLTDALMEIEDCLRKADDIKRSLGAPGDYGYETPTGKALMGLAELTYMVGNNRAVACSILADLERVLLIPFNLPLMDIMAERQRQIDKGWTPAHDDENDQNGRLAIASAAFALQAVTPASTTAPPDDGAKRQWEAPTITEGPLSRGKIAQLLTAHCVALSPCNHTKPLSPREQLVRAGACIVAEIERLDRISNTTEG